MEILRHIEKRSLAVPRPILTMGNFDGLHLGHQALLRQMSQDAKDVGGSSVVLTFEPHPLKILAGHWAARDGEHQLVGAAVGHGFAQARFDANAGDVAHQQHIAL